MRVAVAYLATFLVASCDAGSGPQGDPLDFPNGPGGKADALGRGLVGVAAPYITAPELTDPAAAESLRADVKRRREAAWRTVHHILEPVPLLGLAQVLGDHPEISWPDTEVPTVPRWETWYGVDDLKRMFQHLFECIGEAGRKIRRPFDAALLAEAIVWNSHAVERSDRWPLERYLDHIRDLATCPPGTPVEECIPALESALGGTVTGTTRILYSPGAAVHLLGQYDSAVACLERLDQLAMSAEPEATDNFTACFAEEFPPDAVLIKAQWVRADFDRNLPAFDTDAAALSSRLAGTATWPESGDRKIDPSPNEIYTIRLRDGSVYRLAGMHIMTKELRHWQWVTLWWSDRPDLDFGADRPADLGQLPAVWSRYKMCAVSWFDEADPELARRFEALPTLSAALSATGGAPGTPTWCSNPYLEHGRNNARTNCIGCHQHGGSTAAFDRNGDGVLDPFDLEAVIRDEGNYPEAGRTQIRETFPADYTYSFNRVDDVVHVFAQEIEFFDSADRASAQARIDAVLALSADANAGEMLFADRCSACHGPEGQGGPSGPDLGERVPGRDDQTLVQTLLQGQGAMPAWGGRLDNQQLANLLGFLRARFGG